VLRPDQPSAVPRTPPAPAALSVAREPIRPTVAHDHPSVSVVRAGRAPDSRGAVLREGLRVTGPDRPTGRPGQPYRERALALWPGLDRDRLRRCGNDLAKIVRLVAHTTRESADVIEAMLSARPETHVVMPPVRRPSPIPIDPYVVLPTPAAPDEADEPEPPVTAPRPRRAVTSHDMPWVASTFGGRDGERAGSA